MVKKYIIMLVILGVLLSTVVLVIAKTKEDKEIRKIKKDDYEVWKKSSDVNKKELEQEIIELGAQIEELKKGVNKEELAKCYATCDIRLQEENENDLMFWQEEKLQREELLAELK